MLSSLLKSQSLNDVPIWAPAAVNEITELENLLTLEVKLPDQPTNTLKQIVNLMNQLQQLESSVLNGSVNLSDFGRQINNVFQQVQNLPAPPSQ